MRVGPEPAGDPAAYRQGATVTIATTRGQSFTSTVLVPHGAACLGVGWSEVEAKFRALAPFAPMTSARVDASLAALRSLRAAPDVSALMALVA